MYEKTLQSKTLFEGRVVTLEILDVELENGQRTQREIIRHRGAAVVLAQAGDGRFLFVRQFRKPVDREVLEAVAGVLDDGEEAIDCARREVLEETGHACRSIRHLATVYPSPGYIDERMEMFYAELENEARGATLDHDEYLEVVPLTEPEVCERIRSGELFDAKTLALWLLYEQKVAHA